MAADDRTILCCGALELVLAPANGGAIIRFDCIEDNRRVQVLRAAISLNTILDAASFPLVPYCNRVSDGRFLFRGREVILSPNMPGDPSPLHGQGWLAPWPVESASATQAELVYRHDPGEWPWGV